MPANRPGFARDDELPPRPFEYFFKVISPETMESMKLMLPEKFARVFKDRIPDVAMLKLPNGRVWNVGLTRERGNRNRVWLDSGFGDFLCYHSIVARQLLIFKYDGYSGFKVVVCDGTACEVVFPDVEPHSPSDQEEVDDSIDDEDYELNGDDDDPSEDEEEEISEPDSYEGLGLGGRRGGVAPGSRRRATKTNAGTGRGKRVAGGNGGASGSRQRLPKRRQAAARVLPGRDGDLWRRLVAANIATSTKFASSLNSMSQQSKRAVEKAIRCSDPNYPSAMVVMKDFHIHPGIMYLPTRFARQHFPNDSEGITLCAYEEKRKYLCEAPIVGSRDDKNVLFFRGWGWFCTISHLNEGDVCLFELIDEDRKVFNVHIFRA